MQKIIDNELDVKLTRNKQGWRVSFEPKLSYWHSFLIWLMTTFIFIRKNILRIDKQNTY
jgi:hypothetical protein